MENPKISYDDESAEVVNLHKAEYYDGNLAIVAELVWNDGNKEKTKVSVNLPDQAHFLAEGQFFAKNYSEGERVFNALIASGWIVSTGHVGSSGYARPPVCVIGPNAVIV